MLMPTGGPCSPRFARAPRGWHARAAPAVGARLWAERVDGAIVPMGSQAPAGHAVLRVRLPQAADLRVVRDGATLYQAHREALELEIDERGVYRIEARINGRLWLLSNPIHLR